MDQHYQELRNQIAPHFIEYLSADSIPFYPPALTVCPHCHKQCAVLDDRYWVCSDCDASGDLVDYVVANNHFESEDAACGLFIQAAG